VKWRDATDAAEVKLRQQLNVGRVLDIPDLASLRIREADALAPGAIDTK